MSSKKDVVTRTINAYQRNFRLRYGCPNCRAAITTRHRHSTDAEGNQKYMGSYDACANYKAGDSDCPYYISNVDKPGMREVSIGAPAPAAPAEAYDDARMRVIKRQRPESAKIDLTKFHTRQLLGILRSFRAIESRDYYDIAPPTARVPKELFGFDENDKVVGPTPAELKAELATREHVPNKQEAKKIRQDRAKNRR